MYFGVFKFYYKEYYMILRIEQDLVVSIHPSGNTDQGVDYICKCEGVKTWMRNESEELFR